MIRNSASANASRPILVVTGMAKEMRLAAGPGSIVLGSGGDPDKLRESLAALGDFGCRLVLSFGIAGGLDPSLAPGAVVVASTVAAGDGLWPADELIASRMAARLEAGGMKPVIAGVAGADFAVADASAKQHVRDTTGAAAVDMESHVAAAYAATRRLPFAALRIICDPAGRTLPPLAVKALRADGGIDFPGVLKSLAREPGQLAATLRLAGDARAAFLSLRRCRDLLGIGRGGPDLVELLRDIS